MSTIRRQRVAEMLFQELSILIANELADPRVSLVEVTGVDVSPDLRSVKLFVRHDDEEVAQRQVLEGLKHAVPYMRREIANRCNLRVVPELLFYYDDTAEKAARVDALLRQIAEEREQRSASEEQTPADGVTDDA
jgi:ribosome-binding factor A